MKIVSMSFLIFLLSLGIIAQVKITENTVKLGDNQTEAGATIGDISWLAGDWVGTGLGGVSEERWSKPNGGIMVGTFRLIIDGKPIFYEMAWLMEHKGSLVLRLKHFSPVLVGWEEKDKTVDFPFVDRSGDKMRFSGLTFERVGASKLNIYLAIELKDGSVKEEVFKMERTKERQKYLPLLHENK